MPPARRVRAGPGRQVGEQQAVPVRVPMDEVTVGIGHRSQVGVRITRFRRPRQRPGEIRDDAVGDGSHECGSIRDTLVERRTLDADGLGDATHRDGRQAIGLEDPPGGRDDGVDRGARRGGAHRPSIGY